MDKKNYTISLDIGTNSVGWAVLDDEFNLVKGQKTIKTIENDQTQTKRNRTNLWGARLFDEGVVAADRRLKRGQRRRIARRKKRLTYLRDLFEESILSFDDSFFIRMDESFFQNDDAIKSVKTQYPLFNGKMGEGETYASEVEYYKNYPTIYHLRQRLVEDDSKADLRLVYLALHHIAKFRGHFTNQGQKFHLENTNVLESFSDVLEQFQALAGNDLFRFDVKKQEEAERILTNRQWSKSKKAFELTGLYTVITDENKANFRYYKQEDGTLRERTAKQLKDFLTTIDNQQKAMYTALVGNGIDIAKIFANDAYKASEDNDYPKAGELKYGNEDFEDKLETLAIAEEEKTLLQAGKKVYEAIVLSNILTSDTLAASMVEKYELHKEQLHTLKAFTMGNCGEELYKKFFKKDGIYTNFVSTIGAGNPTKGYKKTARDEFYKTIKKAFEYDEKKKSEFKGFKGLKFPDVDKEFDFTNTDLTDEQQTFFKNISDAMKFDNYLPKQRQSDNGAIPYQVHEHELIEILKNQSKYYDFLGEMVTIETENEEGELLKEQEYKIQALFKFRIPYYVGTLASTPGWVRNETGALVQTDSPAKNSWLVRKSEEKLTPWNFSEVVDKEQSAVNFIERMTNFCTYLPQEKVLPKHSLTYQEFTIYNELIIGGWYEKGVKQYFSPELRQKIVQELFKKNKKVSAQKMLNYLNNTQNLNLESVKELFGIDTFVKSPSYNTSFSTYLDLVKAGIPEKLIEENREKFEEIIKWQTIFEDKKVLKRTIKQANEQRWQNLLTEEQVKKLAKRHYTGWGRLSRRLLDGICAENGKTILENLQTEQYRNFMRLVEDEKIAKTIKNAQFEELDDQTLNVQMVEELAGSPALKKGIWQSLQIVKELEAHLGREKIGKIVVEMPREHSSGRTKPRQKQIEDFWKTFQEKTGEEISPELKSEFATQGTDAFNDEKLFLYFMQNGKSMYGGASLDVSRLSDYEVDHIIPQTYIKDDSIDNKVLVLRSENQNKGGDVPSRAIINSMRWFWELLAKNGQVSPRKLANLTKGSLGEKDKEGFINRQLVETRQITKHVANILSNYFKDSEIEVLTPKAGLTSQFRQGYVFVPKDDFDFEKATAQNLHFAWDKREFLSDGTVKESNYSDAKLVKLWIHDGFVKDRDVNDSHHAHDAYLNGIVATYVYETRPDLRKMWVYGEYQRKAQKEIGKFGSQRKNYFKQLLSDMQEEQWLKYEVDEDGKTLYTNGEYWSRQEVLEKINRTLDLRDVHIVKKTEMQIGKFGDETVYKKGKDYTGSKSQLDPSRYGGTKSPISAFAVVVRTAKGDIKTLSVPAMFADNYLDGKKEKLLLLQELYPKEKIVEIVVEKVAKYTKFVNDGIPRLVSSFQEALKADSLNLTQEEWRSLKVKGVDLIALFDKVTAYLEKNQVYNEEHLTNWKMSVKEEFCNLSWEDQVQFIKDSFSLTKLGTTNAKGMVKGKIGKASGQQQHKGQKNEIGNGTTIVHQSITGLRETRVKLGE